MSRRAKGSVSGTGPAIRPAMNRVGDDETKAPPRRGRGRPASPVPRATRNAEAARRYRARKRAEKEARRDPRQPVRSAIIDLSAVPIWQRG